jgi:hypothetical protein
MHDDIYVVPKNFRLGYNKFHTFFYNVLFTKFLYAKLTVLTCEPIIMIICFKIVIFMKTVICYYILQLIVNFIKINFHLLPRYSCAKKLQSHTLTRKNLGSKKMQMPALYVDEINSCSTTHYNLENETVILRMGCFVISYMMVLHQKWVSQNYSLCKIRYLLFYKKNFKTTCNMLSMWFTQFRE